MSTRDRHNDGQVSCNSKTLQLSSMDNNPSDEQRTIEMLYHNDTGNTRKDNLVIESGGVTDFTSVTDRTEGTSAQGP